MAACYYLINEWDLDFQMQWLYLEIYIFFLYAFDLSVKNDYKVKKIRFERKNWSGLKLVNGWANFILHEIVSVSFPASSYLFKVNNGNSKTMCKIYFLFANLGIGTVIGIRIGIGTDITNAIISTSIMPMDHKLSRVLT